MTTETFELQPNGTYQIIKDPNAHLDYVFPWGDWLALVTDTLVSHEVAIENQLTAGGLITASFIVGNNVIAWVSGGTTGQKIALRCRITTTAGRIDDRTCYLKLKEK